MKNNLVKGFVAKASKYQRVEKSMRDCFFDHKNLVQKPRVLHIGNKINYLLKASRVLCKFEGENKKYVCASKMYK